MTKYLISVKCRNIMMLLALSGILLGLFIIPKSPIEPISPSIESSETLSDIPVQDTISPVEQALKLMENQKEIDKSLLKELNSNAYTFYEPLVIVDPYGLSPLTACAIFTTAESVQISLHISGKTSAADVDFTFNDYKQTHTIPIYGLYPDITNEVILTARNKAGETQELILKIQTAPLPDFLQEVTNISYIADKEKYSPGFNFMFDMDGIVRRKRAVDINGDTRWFLNLPTGFVGDYRKNSTITVTTGANFQGEAVIYNMTMSGRISEVYASDYGAHHDIEFTDSDTMLVTGSSGQTTQDFIYELDRGGEIIRTLDYKTILQRSRVLGIRGDNVDWMHMNSIVQEGNDIIVSSNFQSTVLKNSMNGDIKWMLCDPQGYYAKFWPYILKPLGEDFEYPYNQHAVEILPDYDGNMDTIDILLFDNGLSRNVVNAELQRAIRANEIVEPPLYSRLVHYRINEKNMTVEQIWQYGKERPELFSSYRGDANLLSNGNILGCFNIESYPMTNLAEPDIINNRRSVVYTEVDRENNLIWECFTTSRRADNSFTDYRVQRMPIYSPTAKYINLDVSANNLIGKEILGRYENKQNQ